MKGTYSLYHEPNIEIKDFYQFQLIEEFILNNDDINEKSDCLLIIKDLLAFLKIEKPKKHSFGKYIIYKNNIPLISINIEGKFGVGKIEINDYIKALEKENTIMAKFINFIFD